MPTKVPRYKCDFCNKNYASMGGAKRHEKVCFHNPANKSCVTCAEMYNKTRVLVVPKNQSKIICQDDCRLPILGKQLRGGAIMVWEYTHCQNDKCKYYCIKGLLKEILPMAMWESCSHKHDTEADPTTHCCDWSAVVERIQEVLVNA